MKSKILGRMYALLALSAFGCAGAQVTQQNAAAPISASPPTSVVVYPFAVSAADVSLNSGIFQVAYRNMTDENTMVNNSISPARRRKTFASRSQRT